MSKLLTRDGKLEGVVRRTLTMKARQSAKIRQLGQALIDAGLRTLDAQADALGLPRSTAWTIVKTCHKTSGLSAGSIERMLGSKLPPRARATIVEYVEEKSFVSLWWEQATATAICRSPVQHYRKLVGLRGNAPGTCAARSSGRSCFCAEGYQMAGMDVVLDPTWTIVSGPPLGRVRRLNS